MSCRSNPSLLNEGRHSLCAFACVRVFVLILGWIRGREQVCVFPHFYVSFRPCVCALFYQQTCVVLRFYPEFSVCLPQCEYMGVARSKGRVGVCVY